MHVAAHAIVCAIRVHGEHGAIARLMTPDDGLLAGYVRGGRSRRLRPVLQPGNIVAAEFRARTEDQLAGLTVELVRSRAALLGEALATAAIEWLTTLTAVALPEGQPYPRLHAALSAVLDAVEAAPSARGWAGAVVRYELLLLAELGFGLDLSRCVATGAETQLRYVSPKSAGAVSAGAGAAYADRLLPLPAFLVEGGDADWPQLFDGFRLTGWFLERDVLAERRGDALSARERLISRLKRLA
ncbi:DNA repair protein RecO [Sphingomonas sp. XMGL2]|uniref:DNA repair protein RecO n=1 Tax=Sphingomonas quercus TaxID=2842451 RepID=A0ABS6BDY9_9SPHN|nr:DNA repair protein RecO [Sphingomonas quercus]